MGKGRWLAVLAGVLLLGGAGPRAREMEELRLVTDIVMWAALCGRVRPDGPIWGRPSSFCWGREWTPFRPWNWWPGTESYG